MEQRIATGVLLAAAVFGPATSGAAASDAGSNVAAEGAGAISAPAPAPVAGDTWTYRRVDLFTGLETGRWSVRFLGDDPAGWRFRTLGGAEFAMTTELGHCNRSLDIPEVRCGSVYRFPLTIGARAGYEKLPNAGEYGQHSLDCVVAGRETVTVIAGTFDTFRVDCRGRWESNGGDLGTVASGQLRQSYWYAPAINNEVRSEVRANANKGGVNSQYAVELVGLRPGSTTAEASAAGDGATTIAPPPGSAARRVDPNPFAGRWYGSVARAEGVVIGVELVVATEGGSYRLIPLRAGVTFECYGKAFPIRVTSADDGRLAFDVMASALTARCQDHSVTLQRSERGRLAGATSDGRPLRLVR